MSSFLHAARQACVDLRAKRVRERRGKPPLLLLSLSPGRQQQQQPCSEGDTLCFRAPSTTFFHPRCVRFFSPFLANLVLPPFFLLVRGLLTAITRCFLTPPRRRKREREGDAFASNAAAVATSVFSAAEPLVTFFCRRCMACGTAKCCASESAVQYRRACRYAPSWSSV